MKPINMTQEQKEALIAEFERHINKLTRNSTNYINFSAELKPKALQETEKPTIYINSDAYLKMMMYVRDTATEIAWHGTVIRSKKENAYYIKDVFLYPQKLTAATVETDQEKYNKWLEELDDTTFNSLRFQGHSHVNFAVTPSGTDLSYYDSILQVLPSTDYYIFMILNKSGDTTFLIYDLDKNTIYENTDINVKIVLENTDLIAQIKTQKEQYCEKPVPPKLTPTAFDYKNRPGFYDDYEDFYNNYPSRLSMSDTPASSKYKNKTLRLQKGK